jgi:hypothetical protein
MSENAIDSDSTSKPAPETAKSQGGRKEKKAKPAKKARAGNEPAKPKMDATNKKAEVITMMKRAFLGCAVSWSGLLPFSVSIVFSLIDKTSWTCRRNPVFRCQTFRKATGIFGSDTVSVPTREGSCLPRMNREHRRLSPSMGRWHRQACQRL